MGRFGSLFGVRLGMEAGQPLQPVSTIPVSILISRLLKQSYISLNEVLEL